MDDTQDAPPFPAVESEAESAEKRQHIRIPVHWQAAVMIDQHPVFGRLSDVSRGGVTLMCEANLRPGTKYQLFIRMPTPDRRSYNQLEVIVQVCNAVLVPKENGYRLGMRFLEMRGQTESLLTNYLHTNGG